MLLVRPVIASSANHVRAVFSPYATVLYILYATAMLQQEVQAGKRSAYALAKGCVGYLGHPFANPLFAQTRFSSPSILLWEIMDLREKWRTALPVLSDHACRYLDYQTNTRADNRKTRYDSGTNTLHHVASRILSYLCWLHKISAEKIESFPLQFPGLLTTDMHTE